MTYEDAQLEAFAQGHFQQAGEKPVCIVGPCVRDGDTNTWVVIVYASHWDGVTRNPIRITSEMGFHMSAERQRHKTIKKLKEYFGRCVIEDYGRFREADRLWEEDKGPTSATA